MQINDTGLNIQESRTTLLAQQQQLLQGKRLAQMFPTNTTELPVPDGFKRVETPRGVFHFDGNRVSEKDVRLLSALGRENLILALGPFNKTDVAMRLKAGEGLVVVTERMSTGVEVKAAVGTESTLPLQMAAFEAGKLQDSFVGIETAAEVLARRLI